ncbi:V-type ATP synthase subunit E [Haloimpatiens sp. FM7315]|uniref:V-type ATP synthase subunit E n=1 Tax=Haloimpatiens sp. FM7315 TaxID=3298609 RepID=UPI0035A3C780
MANIDNLVGKIIEESENKKNEILANAKNEEQGIIKERIQKAETKKAEMLEKAEMEAISKKERIVSSSQLKVRNEKLEAKQKMIEKVFEEAVEKLADLPKEDFLKYVETKILSLDICGDESLILNSKGKEIVSENFVEDINKKLLNEGKKGSIKLNSQTRNFKGGFILEKNGIEINNTFEALVSAMKDELEYEVATVLFS